MTLLYGGGAEAGENDAFDPFRIPSIRGHLRFWWRATKGAACSSLEQLRKHERMIWGDTEQRSGVALRTITTERGRELDALARTERWEYQEPRYALFPAQEDRKNIKKVYEGGRFRLEISAREDVIEDVNAALWAWATFGGIGGRTRRGCGAIYCANYAGTWMADAIAGSPDQRRPWPVLKGGRVVIGSRESPWRECWRECIRVLQQFRQDRYRPQGRSRWPEADEIRRKRQQWSSEHAPANPQRGFPRAALGLPIVFQFKTPGDPEPNTLTVKPVGEEKEGRMASTVILRPLATSSTMAKPMLVVLKSARPRELVLRQRGAWDIDGLAQGDRPVLDELAQLAAKEWDGREYPL
jgi:CRISPR-associated protein Cmr1